MKAVVRQAEDRFETKLSQNFERNRKIWKEVKWVQKRVQGGEMRVKDRDENMQVEGKAVSILMSC